MQTIKIKISDIDFYYKGLEKHFIQHFHGIREYLPLLIYLIVGITFLLSGLINGYDFEVMTLNNGLEEVTQKNYGLLNGIGCGLILFALLRFYNNQKSKTSSKLLFSRQRNRQKKKESALEFQLTAESINFNSDLSAWTKKWEYFDFFKISQVYLELYCKSYHEKYPELLVPMNSLSKEQLELIKNHLDGKIKNYS